MKLPYSMNSTLQRKHCRDWWQNSAPIQFCSLQCCELFKWQKSNWKIFPRLHQDQNRLRPLTSLVTKGVVISGASADGWGCTLSVTPIKVVSSFEIFPTTQLKSRKGAFKITTYRWRALALTQGYIINGYVTSIAGATHCLEYNHVRTLVGHWY